MNEYLSKKIAFFSFFMTMFVVIRHSNNLAFLPTKFSSLFSANYFIQTSLSDVIGGMAVPFFFIVSGFFYWYKKVSYISLLKKKVNTLIYPYFLWSVISFSTMFLVQTLPGIKPFFNSDLIIEKPLGYNILDLLMAKYVGQFWYIQTLLVLFVLSPIISWCMKKTGLCFLLIIFILAIFQVKTYIPFLSFQNLLFFLLGILLAENNHILNIKTNKSIILISNIVLLIAVIFCCLVKGHLAIGQNDWSIAGFVTIFLGIYTFWITYDLIENKIWNFKFSKYYYYSFFIYAIHGSLIVDGTKKILLIYHPTNNLSCIVSYFSTVLITSFISFSILVFLKKYSRGSLRILTGNRGTNKS